LLRGGHGVCGGRETCDEKGGQQEISTETRQARYRKREDMRAEQERLLRDTAEINTVHEEWMTLKETLKLRILEKEEE
jgi:hypothetical protein